VPANKFISRIANKNIKNSTIKSKFPIFGIELSKLVIASFNPLFLEMSLRGRKILSIRRAFKKLRSNSANAMEKMAEATMMKSRKFQALRR
jgi:hypothetical protein